MGDPIDEDEHATQAKDSNATVKLASAGPKAERASKPKLESAPDFGPRYRVLGTIGKGGMGLVYRAFDAELQGEVALKVVREDADSNDDSLARFRREIALARRVTSPNVLRVYDLAAHEGLRFLSMEFVDGEDLAALLRREKRIALDRALAIFRQVCAGLAAAHKQGVVHRDLKPQNVLVDREGTIRVADFGLARSIGESGLTASGAVLGSPAYMSPEQVKGDPVDERSDIYSLGVMLYQLVTGETPFQGTTPHSIMEMRLHKKPRPVHELVPDVPHHIEAIAERCLAVDPDQRYRSVNDLITDLDAGGAGPTADARAVASSTARVGRPRSVRRSVVGVAAVAVAGGIAWFAWPHGAEPQPRVPAGSGSAAVAPAVVDQPAAANYKRTFALVLAPEHPSNDPLVDGTIEVVLVNTLRRSTQLDTYTGVALRRLVAKVSPDMTEPNQQFAKKLAVQEQARVLMVRPAAVVRGAGVELSLVATDVATGKVVFENTLEAPAIDESPIVLARLGFGLRKALGENPPAADETENSLSQSLEAIDEYATGLRAGAAGNPEQAISHLVRAVTLDAEFSQAHAALAIDYQNAGRAADATRHRELALKWVDRMSRRDRLSFLGQYYLFTTGQYDRAVAAYKELLETWPADNSARGNLAIAYTQMRDLPRALEVQRATVAANPREVLMRGNLVNMELLAGNFETVRTGVDKLLAEFPRVSANVILYRAIAEVMLNHRDEAVAAYAKHAAADPSAGAAAEADFALAEGRLADAVALLDKGIDADRKDGLVDAVEVKQVMLAEAYWRRGDNARALAAAARVSGDPARSFAAALVQIAAGDTRAAAATAHRLAADPAPDPRAYAKLIEGELLRVRGKPVDAMLALAEGLRVTDVWDGHVLLARAALDAGRLAEAHTEIRAAIDRRGEGAIAFDDTPTVRNIPPLTYDLARIQEALGAPDAAASYRAFIAMHPKPERDILLDAARRRLAAIK